MQINGSSSVSAMMFAQNQSVQNNATQVKASSEANESPAVEAAESARTQVREGEAAATAQKAASGRLDVYA